MTGARRKTRYVALLGAINLGACNRVPLVRLRELCAELGCEDVTTYIASGNLVLTSDQSADELTRALEPSI